MTVLNSTVCCFFVWKDVSWSRVFLFETVTAKTLYTSSHFNLTFCKNKMLFLMTNETKAFKNIQNSWIDSAVWRLSVFVFGGILNSLFVSLFMMSTSLFQWSSAWQLSTSSGSRSSEASSATTRASSTPTGRTLSQFSC